MDDNLKIAKYSTFYHDNQMISLILQNRGLYDANHSCYIYFEVTIYHMKLF